MSPSTRITTALADLHADNALVRDRLAATVFERGLRRSTALSYARLLGRLGILDLPCAEVTLDGLQEALWKIDNASSRRATVIALRAVLGLPLPIPRAIPRRYDLPDEDTLRLALMTCRYEARGLLMAYAGLRIGEACAITRDDLDGDVLRVERQVQQLHETGKPTTLRIGPVKAREAEVVIPDLLVPYVDALTTIDKPDAVREALRRAGRKLGIDLNPHQLRHWYATEMLNRGANLALVSRQLRHSDVATTLRTYVQTKPSDVKRLFDRPA